MLRLSIVIPVYNVELYLADCLDSILAQDFADMEIICVEDKSTDHSLRILEEYGEKFPYIRIFKHENNQGLAAARNTGIIHARGKYIWFIDSDDIIKPGACNLLYQSAEKNKTDIVYFNMEFMNDKERKLVRNTIDYHVYDGVFSGRQMFCLFQEANTPKVESWRQFIRREFILQNNLKFYEGIIHEDVLFSFQTAMKAERVVDLNEILYIYRQRSDSILYSRKEESAFSLFVVLTNIFIFWKNHEFTENENYWIADSFTQLYKSYLFYKNFAQGDMAAGAFQGAFQDQYLYRLLQERSVSRFYFSEKQLETLRKAKKVVLYGAGRIAAEILDVLGQEQIRVHVIAVSRRDGNASTMRGIKIESIELLQQYKEAIVVLGTDRKHHDDIIGVLKRLGFQNWIKPEEKI